MVFLDPISDIAFKKLFDDHAKKEWPELSIMDVLNQDRYDYPVTKKWI